MTTIYWQAPLWQVVLVALTGVAFALAVLRKRRQARLADLIEAKDPAVGGAPIFFFEPGGGVRSLTAAAAVYASDSETGRRLEAALTAAYETGRVQRASDWPSPGQTLTAMPVETSGPATAERCAVAVIGSTALVPLAEGTEGEQRWLPLGADLRVHADRPQVRVRRDMEGSMDWHDATLAPAEDAVLRHLLGSANQVCPAQDLFAAAWPDEPTPTGGLRPEQRDRLRRVVFQLRQRVEPEPADPRYVSTAHGIGYALYTDRSEPRGG